MRGRIVGRASTRLVVVLALLVGVAAGASGTSPAGAAPLPGTALPVRSATSLAVDPGTGRVFVAGDDVVLVRTPTGAAARTITGMYGVREVVAGGGSMWALLGNTSSIARIDPSSMTVTGTWSVAPVGELVGLAYAGGRIWTTGEQDFDGFAVSVDPATGTVTPHELVYYWNTMELAAVPGAPNLLVGGEVGISSGTLHTFDVTGGGFTHLAEDDSDGFVRDIAVTADGSKVLVAGYGPVREWRLPDLVPTGVSYPQDSPAIAVDSVAVAGGHLVLAAGAGHSTDPIDVSVFRAGAPTAIYSGSAHTDDLETIDGGVALAPGGGRAYVLRSAWYVDPYDAELVVVQLGPVVSTIAPRVHGTRGGGTLTVTGSGLGLTSVSVGGAATSGSSGSGTSRSVTVPALAAGSKTVVVRNLAGIEATAPTTVVVRDLGPFRESTAFADRQHRDFLGRPATAAERASADGTLASGPATVVGALPLALARSTTWAGDRGPVIRLYQAIFLRPPDTAGLDYWVWRIRAGRSLTWVASAMAAAPEFRTRYGALSDVEFVERIYQNVLGRPAEPAGRDYWVGVLASGRPRGVMVIGFSQSPEYRAKLADQVDVTNLYLGMLRRAPTGSELAAALAEAGATSVQAVAAGIVTSSEYRTRVG